MRVVRLRVRHRQVIQDKIFFLKEENIWLRRKKGQRSVANQLASKNRRITIKGCHVSVAVVDGTRQRQGNSTFF